MHERNLQCRLNYTWYRLAVGSMRTSNSRKNTYAAESSVPGKEGREIDAYSLLYSTPKKWKSLQ